MNVAGIIVACTTLLTILGVLFQNARYRSKVRDEVRSEVRNEVRSEMQSELQPNGGKSLRDTIDRIERRQIDHGERLVAVETRLLDHIKAGQT